MAFGEDGGLALGPSYEHDLRWRWRPLDQVQDVFESLQAPLIIAKPIVESQRALELLSFFPRSKIIWAYRDYRDVAQSSIALFGADSSLHNLRAVLDPKMRAHWFSQNLSDESRDLVRRFFDPGRPLADLKLLGWLVRNSLYFQLQLDRNPRVAISRYENLVRSPVVEMTRLYAFLGASFPGPQVCRHMHRDSLRKGRDAEVSADVEKLCRDLLERLHGACARAGA
jgi:sulfotransferase family protein